MDFELKTTQTPKKTPPARCVSMSRNDKYTIARVCQVCCRRRTCLERFHLVLTVSLVIVVIVLVALIASQAHSSAGFSFHVLPFISFRKHNNLLDTQVNSAWPSLLVGEGLM